MSEWARALDVDVYIADIVAGLVSELVTNAVQHSRRPEAGVQLSARLRFGLIRIDVVDGGGESVPEVSVPSGPEGGYGLLLVSETADSWGTERNARTRVWFEMRAWQPPAPDAAATQ